MEREKKLTWYTALEGRSRQTEQHKIPPSRVSSLSSTFLFFSMLLSSLRCFLETGSKDSLPVSIESLESMTSLELAKIMSDIALFVFVSLLFPVCSSEIRS